MRPRSGRAARHLNLMKETLTVRDSVRAALRRGSDRLYSVRWLYEQGSELDWDVFFAEQRVRWVTEHARDLALWEASGRHAYARHRAKVLGGLYES